MSVHCSDLPDGKYVAEILSLESTRNKKGVPMVEWRLRIAGGKHDGAVVPKKFYFSQDSAEKAKKVKDFLFKECKLIGMHIESAAEFQEVKSKFIGKRIIIEAVSNEEDWQNYFVKGLAGNDGVDEPEVENDDDLGW